MYSAEIAHMNMDTNAPQFTPAGGIGSTYGNYTYGQSGWTSNAPKPAPKPKTVFSSKPAKDQVNGMQNVLNNQGNNLQGLLSDFEKGYSDYQSTLGLINSGNLTPEEQRMLDASRALMMQDIEEQKLRNKKYEAGVEQMGIRSGRQRYATEIQGGMQKAAVDQGVAAVNDLNLKMESKLADMRQALIDKKYDKARQAYSDYNDYVKERRSIISEINKNALESAKSRSASKAAKTAASMKAYDGYIRAGGKLGYDDWAIMANQSYDLKANPVPITSDFASKNNLPQSLVGFSTADIINSLSSEEPPEWFTIGFAEGLFNVNTQPGLEEESLQQLWDQFKNQESIMAISSGTLPDSSETVSSEQSSITSLPSI